MSKTTIIESTEDTFDGATGEIRRRTTSTVHKSYVEPTDEFIKVSKYLNVIFAYNDIPLNLVGISLLLAQRMHWKTNELYLLKGDKEQIAEMLGVSYERVAHLILDCKKYDIIRPVPGSRGKYEVNAFLFSTGDLANTRRLQAHIDFDTNSVITQVDIKNPITGETVRRSVVDAKGKKKLPNEIEGQLSLEDLNG